MNGFIFAMFDAFLLRGGVLYRWRPARRVGDLHKLAPVAGEMYRSNAGTIGEAEMTCNCPDYNAC